MQKLKKGQANVAIEMLVIILFVLVVLYPIATTTVTPGTTLTSVVNESVTVTAPSNGSTVTLAGYPLDGTALVLKNHTGTPTLSTPQNYTVNATTGVITFNTTAWGNVSTAGLDWHATYQYQPAGYDTNASNRVLLSVVTTIILVIGVMLLIAKINV